MIFQDLFINLYTNFIYFFRCVNPNKKPAYQNTNVDEELEYSSLININIPRSFVIIRD
jgi:hypothetical protein